MKTYNNDSIFSSNDPAPTPAEPSPAPKVDRETSAKKNKVTVEELIESSRKLMASINAQREADSPEALHAEYRRLQKENPRQATIFWNQNKDQICAARGQKRNG